MTAHAFPGVEISPATELVEIFDEIDRICSLPFWLEDVTGRCPTDAELLSWRTVEDVLRWIGARKGIAA